MILSQLLGDKWEFDFQNMWPMRWRQQLVSSICQKEYLLRSEFEDSIYINFFVLSTPLLIP